MKGSLSEFTLAELLQLFALAEKSGTVSVDACGRRSRLFLEAGRVSGWGEPTFDVQAAAAACELLPPANLSALASLAQSRGEPGLDFIIRNLLEPHRWEWFTQRLLEQDIFPLLSLEEGQFDVDVENVTPPPIALSLSVQQVILDGSRWEADIGEFSQAGYALDSIWRRAPATPERAAIELAPAGWLTWAALRIPASIGALAGRVAMPDIATAEAVRRLHLEGLIEPDP